MGYVSRQRIRIISSGTLFADGKSLVKLDIRLIKDVKPGRSWDELVLPRGHRKVVQAMVQHHAVSPKENTNNPKIRFRSDLVEGKGKDQT